MNRGKLSSTVLWLLFFGCVGLAYGIPILLGNSSASSPQLLQSLCLFFAFGMWAGIVIIGEDANWLPGVRRGINAGLLAGLSVFAAWLVSSPSPVQAVLLAIGFAFVGWFGEWWVPYA